MSAFQSLRGSCNRSTSRLLPYLDLSSSRKFMNGKGKHYQFKGCIIWYSIQEPVPWARDQSWLHIRVQFPINMDPQTVQEAIDCVTENTEALVYDIRRTYPLAEYIEIVRQPIDGVKIVDAEAFLSRNIPASKNAGWINACGRSSWISINGKIDWPQKYLCFLHTEEFIVTEYGGYVAAEEHHTFQY